MFTVVEVVGKALSDVTVGEWITAGIAAVAAAIVAWQSWETRRSAKAAAQAAQAAVKGLAVATSSLEVARTEEQHSRSLVTEAHRARLDAAMPEISVHFGPTSSPPFVSNDPSSTQWRPLLEEEELVLPRDQSLRVAVASQVEIHNGSNRVVNLTVTRTPFAGEVRTNFDTGLTELVPPRPGVEAITEEVRLQPGKRRLIAFLTWTWIQNWMDEGAPLGSYNAWDERRPITVSFEDAADSSVTVGWEVSVEGSPLEPVADKTAVYRVASNLPTFRVGTQNRIYWLSKKRQISLDPR